MSPCVGRAIDWKEESRPYSGLMTKDRCEVEHGDAALCQGVLKGLLQVGHGVAEQREVGFFLTRLEHHEDIGAVRLRPRLEMLQRLQHEVEGLLVRLRFGTRCVDKKFSATRLCWSKGIGGGDAFMKLCSSSSGCKTRPAKGEPA